MKNIILAAGIAATAVASQAAIVIDFGYESGIFTDGSVWQEDGFLIGPNQAGNHTEQHYFGEFMSWHWGDANTPENDLVGAMVDASPFTLTSFQILENPEGIRVVSSAGGNALFNDGFVGLADLSNDPLFNNVDWIEIQIDGEQNIYYTHIDTIILNDSEANPVPEVQTYGMFLAGGLAAVQAFRRRRAARA